MTTTANTTPAPRHAARPPQRLRSILYGLRRAAQWVERKADEPMTSAGYALCGAIMGLSLGPIIYFCYFG